MRDSSRSRAHTWPYPRHREFEDQLRRTASKWFADRSLPVDAKYPFILAEWERWQDNLIDREVAGYIESERQRREASRQGFPLNKYVHHGLSSQAMLFNLVGPLMIRKDLSPLRDALEKTGIEWPAGAVEANFEFEDRTVFNEDSGQPTSIDLVLRDGGGLPRVFIEAKLVERAFGGCSVFVGGDCDGLNPARDPASCYLHHIGRRYWTRLQEHGFVEGPLADDVACVLANHYQFFRELLLALHLGGVFVLLSDERNPTFHCRGSNGCYRGLMPLLLALVPEALRTRVGSVSIQQVVAAVNASGRHPWISEFEAKYGLSH